MFGQEMNLMNMLSNGDTSETESDDDNNVGGKKRGTSNDIGKDIMHISGETVKVEIVVQFFKVGEIDTLKEQFNADVIVKAKWREPKFDGQLSINETVDFGRLWNPKLYIENSLGDPKEQIRHRLLFNDKGEAYIYEKRVAKGTFMENLELDDFPFDVQDLTITVASELPSSECELVEDKEEHHVVNRQSFVDEQEWHLYVHTECDKKELVIDQVDNSVKRSALSVKCRAARRPGYFVWNIFMITFLICSLAFATFSVEKDLPQNRLQLSFTLVLTAVAFKSVVNSSLPRISYLTYMDKYLLVSMVMLSAVCTWHAIVTRLLYDRGYADRIENIVLTILGVLYVIYNIGFVVIIYLFPCKKRRVMSQKDKEYKTSIQSTPVKWRSTNSGLPKSNSGSQIQEETSASRAGTTGGDNGDVEVLKKSILDGINKVRNGLLPPLLTSDLPLKPATNGMSPIPSVANGILQSSLVITNERTRDDVTIHVSDVKQVGGWSPKRLRRQSIPIDRIHAITEMKKRRNVVLPVLDSPRDLGEFHNDGYK